MEHCLRGSRSLSGARQLASHFHVDSTLQYGLDYTGFRLTPLHDTLCRRMTASLSQRLLADPDGPRECQYTPSPNAARV